VFRRDRDKPEQLPLPTPSAPKSRQRIKPAPEQAAKAYIARRAKPSVVPGHVKLTFTLDMPREVAERLSARAIWDQRNIEAVVIRILEQGKPMSAGQVALLSFPDPILGPAAHVDLPRLP